MLPVLLGSIVVIVFLSTGLYFFLKTPESQQAKINKLVVENGRRNRTILPDGSTVWLNAASTLSYDHNFKGNAREVYFPSRLRDFVRLQQVWK